MIEQVDSDIYRIEIPLPGSPLKATNSYFIRGFERNLLIDTGFNCAECREAMDEAQSRLNFKMDNTDLFLTHIHADHVGLAGYLARPGTSVYAGEFYADYLRAPQERADDGFHVLVVQSGLAQMGMSPEDTSVHPGYEFASSPVGNIRVIREGDVLDVGDIHLRCIETAGHTPDHLCLYEEQRKLLFSGDHVLGTITPNNTIWEDPWEVKKDYLGMYLKNLDKLSHLPIELTLPGHRALIEDCHKRIEELKAHHERRLNLVLNIMNDGAFYTGAQIAAQMGWDIRAKSWEDFPPTQKLFATGEALSHLTHLIFRGEVCKELRDGVVYFSKVREDSTDKAGI